MRGPLDGLAYWPESGDRFWLEVASNRASELARYAAVIHLRSPSDLQGYNYRNPVRIESATEAHRLDEQILRAWQGHSRLCVVESAVEFLDKAKVAMQFIREQLPECCRKHPIGELADR